MSWIKYLDWPHIVCQHKKTAYGSANMLCGKNASMFFWFWILAEGMKTIVWILSHSSIECFYTPTVPYGGTNLLTHWISTLFEQQPKQ